MPRNNTLREGEAVGSNLQPPVSWEAVRSGALSMRRFDLSGSETLPVMPPQKIVTPRNRNSPRKVPKVRPIITDSPNTGPNPEGFGPKPWGLLDFQDVAIFLCPDKRIFEIEEQCLILRHRNAKLRDLTPEELDAVREWITQSRTIDVEGEKVDLGAWRRGIKPKDLKKLIKTMEADLKSATIMKEAQEREEKRGSQKGLAEEKSEETVSPSVNRRKRKFIVEDSDDE